MFRRPPGRRPVLLAILALAALAQAGCQSGFYGPCGATPCGRPMWGTRWFRPAPVVASSGCCGPTVGVPMTSGPTIVGPAMPYGGTVVPGSPGVMSTVPDSSSSGELTPAPLPRADPAPPLESSPGASAKPATGKATYEARQQAFGNSQASARPQAGRAGNSRSVTSTPVPTPRSAQGSGVAPTAAKPGTVFTELDNLPPLDIPNVKTSADATTPPIPPAVEREKTPATNSAPAPSANSSAATGIERFAGVESKLAGGSLPDAAGLDWLVSKGYRTILDLRESASVSPSFLNDVDRHGLRYVSLPISLKTLDAPHVARFHSELALADARPLYFFDNDGSRAGTLWFIHRVTVDHIDRQVARREAEEIGLRADAFLQAATAYLDRLIPPATPVVTTGKTAGNAAGAAADAVAPSIAGASPPDSEADNRVPLRDPASWKPLAVLVVTGVAAPLAYFTSSAFPVGLKALSRASLSGPRRSPKSLPHGSDV